MTLTAFLMLASLLDSTTYGYGEKMCGDVGKPVVCAKGAITASGEPFDVEVPQVALALPAKWRVRAQRIKLRVSGGKCQWVRLVDKMNARWVGLRGFDLNPAALSLLTGNRAIKHWTGRVEICR